MSQARKQELKPWDGEGAAIDTGAQPTGAPIPGLCLTAYMHAVSNYAFVQ